VPAGVPTVWELGRAWHGPDFPDSRGTPLPRLYAKNRRDGARLLSSALVITSIGLIRIDHPVGRVVGVLGSLVCLYWWSCYRTLER